MTAADAIDVSRRLLGVSLFVQAIEMLLVARALDAGEFAFEPWRARLRRALRGVLGFAGGRGWSSVAWFQAALGVGLVVAAPSLCLPFAALTLGVLTARFAGHFNGGSDGMTRVVLGALLLDGASPWEPRLRLVALGWIAVQLTASYFVAGMVKARESLWRSGDAVAAIVNSGHYDVPLRTRAWLSRPAVSRAASWGTLAFELSSPVVYFLPRELALPTLALWSAVALVFHLTNAWVLGLNRFVFAWAAAYPALFFFALR